MKQNQSTIPLTEVLVVFRMARTLPAKGRIILSPRQETLQSNGTKIVCNDTRPLGEYPKKRSLPFPTPRRVLRNPSLRPSTPQRGGKNHRA